MKNSTRVLLAVVLLGAAGVQAAEADRPRTYAEAVAVYVDAATVQLRALRGEDRRLKWPDAQQSPELCPGWWADAVAPA